MLSKPTTDQAIEGVARDLAEIVLPALSDEPARVAVQMMQQILRSSAVRAAHEVAWMHEELAAIRDAALPVAGDPAVAAALAALDDADADSLHLADVQRRYDLGGEVLSCVIEAAYAAGDADRIATVRGLLQQRTDHEMEAVGQLDLVGRG